MKHANKNLRWNVLAAIEYVCKNTKEKQLKFPESKQFKERIARLQNYFGGISEMQVVFLCALADIHLSDVYINKGHRVEQCPLFVYLGISGLQLSQHIKEIRELKKRGILKDEMEDATTFQIKDAIYESLLQNESLHLETEKTDALPFVAEIVHYINSPMNYFSKMKKCRESESIFSDLPFVRKIKMIVKVDVYRFCFYYVCNEYSKGLTANLLQTFQEISDRFIVEAKRMLQGNHILQRLDLVEFVVKGNANDSTLTLTEKGKEIFLGEDASLFEKKIDEKSVIMPEKIMAKKLFYSEENQRQIESLQKSLGEKNLCRIQKSLEEKGLSKGMCVLLYGAPGTGKTETVYQLAKATNRQIFHVDISKTKSCWFGECLNTPLR